MSAKHHKPPEIPSEYFDFSEYNGCPITGIYNRSAEVHLIRSKLGIKPKPQRNPRKPKKHNQEAYLEKAKTMGIQTFT